MFRLVSISPRTSSISCSAVDDCDSLSLFNWYGSMVYRQSADGFRNSSRSILADWISSSSHFQEWLDNCDHNWYMDLQVKVGFGWFWRILVHNWQMGLKFVQQICKHCLTYLRWSELEVISDIFLNVFRNINWTIWNMIFTGFGFPIIFLACLLASFFIVQGEHVAVCVEVFAFRGNCSRPRSFLHFAHFFEPAIPK